MQTVLTEETEETERGMENCVHLSLFSVGSRWLRCYWPVQIRGGDPHLMLDDLSTERRLTSFSALFTAAVWPLTMTRGAHWVPAERVNGPECPQGRASQLPSWFLIASFCLFLAHIHIKTFTHTRDFTLTSIVFILS